ncbi:hypothetical protein FNV43_RR10557 [Rhamnella rubrinervis]|uniref:Uncharacterized protein n=1 Tax=Rhamnella rubrinervis TaxID=2594499 RepID=A0A8K0H3Z8_9ROSA|nr:hypothetical protein FNV43_RR10557 [Rhamnella rubrinervis]
MTNAATAKITTLCESNTTIARRSGGFKPTIWNFDYIQSLSSGYVEESCSRRVNELKEEVRVKLDDVEGDPLAQLELIDMLQKLGLSYLFEDQIDIILQSMFTNFTHSNNNQSWNKNNLYATALQFRLLRQHGYWISEEVFNAFKEETGNFKESLCEDTEGILSLYQASYYLIDGESILEEARDFATKHLREYMQRPRNIDDDDDQILSALVGHALELPLHWRVARFETRWRMSAIVNALIVVIDDTYDVYGTLEELEVFTNAVERWDVNAIDHMPDYMKLCFLSLHSAINEIAYDVFKEQGIHILKYLKNEGMLMQQLRILSLKEDLQTMDEYPKIVHWSSMILRLANDLGTSSDEIQRGDNPKSIQCYMKETGASEADAREHIKLLIDETWKKLNKYKKENSGFSKIYIERAMHLGRTAQSMYLYGDGYGVEDKETKHRVLSLFFNPIPLN